MTSLPPNADELVSAYVDGEAAPDEIAIVESNPELMARAETMRSLTNQLGAPLSPPPAQREAHIAAALGAFDELLASPQTDSAPPATLRSVPAGAAAEGTGTGAETSQLAGEEVERPEVKPETARHGNVSSLEAARERRRPRRLTALIAASAACVLLFIGLSALSGSFGRSGTDLATNAADVSAASESDFAANSAQATQESGGLSDAGPEISATSPPLENKAADASDAMDDTAMDDTAMDDTAMDDAEAMADTGGEEARFETSPEAEAAMDDDASSNAAGAAAPQATPAPLPTPVATAEAALFYGTFATEEDLRRDILSLQLSGLDARARQLGDGLFPRGCQSEIPELTQSERSTLIARATIDDVLVEVHLSADAVAVAMLYIVDAADCSVLSTNSLP